MAERSPKELRAARRRARLSAQGQRQLEKQTRRARQLRHQYEETHPPVDGGQISETAIIGQLVREIGAKPCASSPTGRFDGLPKYSSNTVRHGVENMTEYERNLARRISSGEYRDRASTQGNFNVWWYHGGKRGKR
jgi:hypothetical protein